MDFPEVNRSHIVTNSYLRNFAYAQRIALRLIGQNQTIITTTDQVGVRKGFYKRHRPDGARIDDVEWSMSQLERAAAPLLRETEQRWPLTHHERGVLAQFIALQLVRGPRWADWHEEFLRCDLRKLRSEGVPDYDGVLAREITDRTVARLETSLGTKTYRLTRMLALVPRIAAALGSMRWDLLVFNRPLLATADHPVVLWPIACASREPSSTPLGLGVFQTLEVRMPLTPKHALLMTWVDEPDRPSPTRPAAHHARNLNAFTIANAEKQWFHLPHTSPPAGTGRFISISADLFQQYDAHTARQSRRRAIITDRLMPTVGGPIADEFDMVTIAQAAGASRA